jgi:hypothetical protein
MTGPPPHPTFYQLRWGPVNFCLGWPQTIILLISIFHIARIIGMSHHVWLEFLKISEALKILFQDSMPNAGDGSDTSLAKGQNPSSGPPVDAKSTGILSMAIPSWLHP